MIYDGSLPYKSPNSIRKAPVLHQEFATNFINISIGSSLNGINSVEIPFSPCYTVTAKAIIGSSRKSVKSWSSSNPQSSPQPHLALAGGEEVELEHEHQLKDNNGISRKESSGYLVRDHEYGWQVRKMVQSEDEIREVANVQAEAFYEPVFFFNALFFHFFKAEVLSGLLYRLKNSPPQRYACLVAQHWKDTAAEMKAVVGVVDATVFRDRNVLRHLQGANEYLYISGIAVLRKCRRQKVATTLLKACEMVANQWGFEYLVLMAYEDDLGAQTLYTNVGYKVVSKDPPWLTSWIGRRRRVLMVKRSNEVNSL